MTNALSKAFANSQRSYFAAKATTSQAVESLMARGPSGLPVQSPDLFRSAEQLRHFRGWVYSSIRPIAQRIAGQPIFVGRLKSKRTLGTKAWLDAEPFDSHPIIDLFNDPNDLMVRWSLMFSMVASLELTGRQLWWLPKKEQVIPIPTSWIREFKGKASFESFKVQPPYTGEAFDIPADECVYIAYPHPGDPHGVMSPLMAVGGAVDADEAITTSQVSMFRNGITPQHAVIVGKNPSPEVPGGLRPRLSGPQQRQIIEAIRRRYADAHRHGEPVILDGLIEDIKKLSHSPAEMDWINSGKSTKERISQGFGTNPIIMGEIEGANRASSTVADQHFCDWTVNPKIELISQCLTEYLSPMFGDDLVVWIEPCVPNDVEMKLKWLEMLARHKSITGDELRELAPFDLKIGDFTEPVGSGDPLEPARNDLREAIGKSSDQSQRIADHILSVSRVHTNGRVHQ